ncbi:MAG: AAA family ATPase [Chromatiaceae bacterium]|nr:AAA family ATPase [Chromatiaceae bacterium]
MTDDFRIVTEASSRGNKTNRRDALRQVIQEIKSMTGLRKVKTQLQELMNFAQVVAIRRDRDLPEPSLSLHMVFTGSPGTGKTVIARKVGKLLNAIGLLKTDKFVEADRSQLVGNHLGDTAKLVRDKVDEATDGVLFIDEAYTLGGAVPGQPADLFGKEAIDTLLKLMEDRRDRLVVIVAGYDNEIRRFIDQNVGLKSRFTRFIKFDDYSAEELFEIFEGFIKDARYQLTPEAKRLIQKEIDRMRRGADERFGNARAVRQLFESMLPIQAQRIVGPSDDFESLSERLSDEDLITLTADDVRAVTE